ncbi:Phenol 2-monooxygenase [Escovopsis weberi]|uniref:Phenol 2-monooxygenase n=1 Tax=Escovopsis weberi TaxID=150374 RepID=A0A0M9VRJ6_ESCWE|nr:Phenol 2-monooxygenase [Escovopsis weberi]
MAPTSLSPTETSATADASHLAESSSSVPTPSPSGTESCDNSDAYPHPLTLLQNKQQPWMSCDVCVIGAGPAGLMLASNLVRFGINVQVIDDRADPTPVGRADGLQPKSIETFRQMRLVDPLLQRGVKVFDISFWRSTPAKTLHRLGREVHYPPVIDVLDPYILLVHQGIIEGLFIDDMKKRGMEVLRNTTFESYSKGTSPRQPIEVICHANQSTDNKVVKTGFLIGCDGAHSKVLKSMSNIPPHSITQPDVWGVLDGELITEFPDIWSKTLVYSEQHGSILIVPRERNMTRLYIELKASARIDRHELGQAFVMEQARKIMAPFSIDWKYIEWFGRYQVGQRVASHFADPQLNVFIAGDASHTHSPKSAQGMNTSLHDSWNLAWKLNLAVRGFAKEILLASYESERRKIALDLVNFDYEHANRIAAGDAVAMAENFRANVRFISGIGAVYGDSDINWVKSRDGVDIWGAVQPGCLLPPAKATRYIDSNPVDIQLDIPTLGQFRIYILVRDVMTSTLFLDTFCESLALPDSLINQLSAAASVSYAQSPRAPSPEDIFSRPERYNAVSHLFTFALITANQKSEIELSDLPELLQDSRWTIYLDDVPRMDTKNTHCIHKWLGSFAPNEVAIINVRPDGYVGSVGRWDITKDDSGHNAALWLSTYYGGFMKVPS